MNDETPKSLKQALAAPTPEKPEPDDELDLPALRSMEYQPHGRATHRPVPSIHFVSPRGEVRSFQYIDLDSNTALTSEGIALRFDGMRPAAVQICGRNLWRLYDYIHQHRMPWVMEVAKDRDFAKDGETVVTAVRFLDPSGDQATP